MFEREIKFIYDFNLNKVKQFGAQITFAGLQAVPIHPAITQYISAEIDYLIFDDRKYLLQNSTFDYSGEKIGKYFLLINEEIKKEKKLAFDYIDQLILQAASFTVNYLVQPSWSLNKLIFEKENNIPVSEARQIINYVYYYEYLKNIIEKYFRKKNLVSVNKDEFKVLLEKIDREVFDQYSEKIIDKVLFSMGDFFNIGSLKKTSIPLTALEVFLKEKKLDQFIERIQNACYPDPKSSYDISEIRKILFSPIPIKKDRYIDRVIKQEIPDSVFNNIIKEEEPAPYIPDKQKSFTSLPEPLPSRILNDQSPENNAEREHEEKLMLDKEDPGNLDYSDGPEQEEISSEEIPDSDQQTISIELDQITSELNKAVRNESKFSDDSDQTIEIDKDYGSSDTHDNDPDTAAKMQPPDTGQAETPDKTIIINNVHPAVDSNITDKSRQKDTIGEEKEFLENPMTARTQKQDISFFLSGKDMEHIITNIFNEDTEDFALTFEKISESKTEEQALAIIDNVLTVGHIKPSSKDALILKRIINEYFNQ